MGASPARSVGPRRSRPRAYLLLSRVSNLPTVWSNVLAGWTIANGWSGEARPLVTALAVAVSLMYTAGMFLNDAFDARFDAERRSDRPIPAGEVARGEAFAVGILLLLAGTLMLAVVGGRRPFAWGLALAAAIVFYDYRHKGFRFGPIVMGVCRGLVYCVAASVTMQIAGPVAAAALLLTLYTASLTIVAKQAGPRADVLVPVMIAGISIVDALVIVASGGGVLALVAVACFALTLALQRVVPGT